MKHIPTNNISHTSRPSHIGSYIHIHIPRIIGGSLFNYRHHGPRCVCKSKCGFRMTRQIRQIRLRIPFGSKLLCFMVLGDTRPLPESPSGRARLWEALGDLWGALGERWEGRGELSDGFERLNSMIMITITIMIMIMSPDDRVLCNTVAGERARWDGGGGVPRRGWWGGDAGGEL